MFPIRTPVYNITVCGINLIDGLSIIFQVLHKKQHRVSEVFHSLMALTIYFPMLPFWEFRNVTLVTSQVINYTSSSFDVDYILFKVDLTYRHFFFIY